MPQIPEGFEDLGPAPAPTAPAPAAKAGAIPEGFEDMGPAPAPATAAKVASFAQQPGIQTNADLAPQQMWNQYGQIALQSQRPAITAYAQKNMGMGVPAEYNEFNEGGPEQGAPGVQRLSQEQEGRAAVGYLKSQLTPERVTQMEQRARQGSLANALPEAVQQQQTAAEGQRADQNAPQVGRIHGLGNALERGTVNDLFLKNMRTGANLAYDAAKGFTGGNEDQPGAEAGTSQLELSRAATNQVLDPAIAGIDQSFDRSSAAKANPGGLQSLAENTVQAAPSLLGMKGIGAGGATGAASMGLAGIQGAGPAYDRAYQDALAQGMSESAARTAADQAALVGGVTNVAAMRYGALGQKAATGAGALARGVKGFATGGAAQAATGLGQRLIGETANSALTGAPISQENITGGIKGDILTGGAFGAIHGVAGGPHPETVEKSPMLSGMREKTAAATAPEAAKPPVTPEAVPAPKTPETAQPAPVEPWNKPEFDTAAEAQPRLYGANRKGAIAIPSREDVTGPGSIYHEEVKPQLEKFNKAATETFAGLKQWFPVETGAGSEEAQNAFREHFNRNANEHFAAQDAFEPARKGFDKMAPADQLAFQRAMYNKEAQPTPELQKIADAMYADTNEGRKDLESLGHEAAAEWDKQKWNMLWKKDPKQAADLLGTSGNPNRPGRIEGKAGFLKQKTLGDFDDGLQKGLVPAYTNPAEMFLATKAERGKYVAGVRGMEQLVRNDQIVRGPKDQPIPAGWSEVPGSAKGPLNNVLATGEHEEKLKGDGPLIAPDGVNRILKNITTPSAIGNKAAFRLASDINNTMTQSLLGLSGFHVKKVSQELINLSAARALDLGIAGQNAEARQTVAKSMISPFAAVRSGANIQKMMLGQMEPQTGQQAQVIDAMKSQFKARPDKEYETQWGRKFQKALDQGGVQGLLRAGAHALPAANEHLMQNGVFSFVQHAKLHMGSELVTDYLNKNPNATHEQLMTETGKISDHLDNVLGLMNRDNLFWNRTARDLATLSTLSVGWNYGSARALGGGLVDLGKGLGSLAKGGKLADVDTRRISYLATTAALTALTGAATTYMATGKAPQNLRDYVFPPSGGKDREGHDIRLNTGFYTSDYFDFFHDPIGTLKAKGSPLMHVASDLLSNRDYKGDKITDWSDEKWYQNAADVAKYLGKSATPMSMQQLHDVISGGGEGKSLGMKMAGFAGVKTAPRNLSMSDAENAAHQVMQGKESVAGRSVREAELSGVKGKLADEVRDKNPAAQQDIQDAIRGGKLTGKDAKSIFKRANEPLGLPGLLKSSELDARDLMDKVWPKMTPQERKDNQWTIRGKIGKANLSPEQRQTYWSQISKDVVAK